MPSNQTNVDIQSKTTGLNRITRQDQPFIKKFPPLHYHLIKTGLAAVFIWSGISKLLAPHAFAVVIEGYGLVPEDFVFPAAIALCLLELMAGVGLLFDVQGSLSIISGLLVLFICVLSYGLWLGLDVDCGCFGPDDPQGQAFHGLRTALLRDITMLAGAGYLYFFRIRQAVKPRPLSDILSFIFRRECPR